MAIPPKGGYQPFNDLGEMADVVRFLQEGAANSFQVSVGVLASIEYDDVSTTYSVAGVEAAAVDLNDWTEIKLSLDVESVTNTADLFLGYRTAQDTYSELTTERVVVVGAGEYATDWEPIPAGARRIAVITLRGENFAGADHLTTTVIPAVVAHIRR